ncbi:single-stranded DNA-binding protein [Acidovorax radicis]|uniref:single-stranded DNA-binding protein n=1 Tax=Acidovorax radicis TaxID=758826 RepID=UPI001CFBD07C|nr:single-stranded DNA-binding protein [Acidovorax radicis]UCV00255.1 single-stranded DNA-binding protein [Acidovorax radicis]
MAKMYGLMRLGRDAEVKTLPSGKQVANLSLVYNFGQKEGDEYPSQWIDAAFWGERAEKLAPFLLKGSLHLFTLGDVHIEKYTDKDGYEAQKLAARVDDVELGPKRDTGQGGSDSQPQRRPAAAPAPTSRPAPPPQSGGSGFDEMEDSIPFRDPLSYRGAHLVL